MNFLNCSRLNFFSIENDFLVSLLSCPRLVKSISSSNSNNLLSYSHGVSYHSVFGNIKFIIQGDRTKMEQTYHQELLQYFWKTREHFDFSLKRDNFSVMSDYFTFIPKARVRITLTCFNGNKGQYRFKVLKEIPYTLVGL